MMYNVTDIEFDLTDDYGEDSNLSFDDEIELLDGALGVWEACLLYTSPSPRDEQRSRMPSSA